MGTLYVLEDDLHAFDDWVTSEIERAISLILEWTVLDA